MRASLCFALAFLVVACTHDFGPFEPTPGSGEGGSKDAAKKDAADPADGPCTHRKDCLDTATSCSSTCTDTQATCMSACSGNLHCTHVCMKTAGECAATCVTDCTSCAESAGCPAMAQCQAAAH